MTDRNFNLCSSVCKKIIDKYGCHTFATDYSEAERTVVLVWTVTGIIENGGFRYLFGSTLPGDLNYTLTIASFREIGCLKAAEVIRKAVCLFPGCKTDMENLKRITWFEKQPEELRNRLDTEFWTELENITLCLANYIREKQLNHIN